MGEASQETWPIQILIHDVIIVLYLIGQNFLSEKFFVITIDLITKQFSRFQIWLILTKNKKKLFVVYKFVKQNYFCYI